MGFSDKNDVRFESGDMHVVNIFFLRGLKAYCSTLSRINLDFGVCVLLQCLPRSCWRPAVRQGRTGLQLMVTVTTLNHLQMIGIRCACESIIKQHASIIKRSTKDIMTKQFTHFATSRCFLAIFNPIFSSFFLWECWVILTVLTKLLRFSFQFLSLIEFIKKKPWNSFSALWHQAWHELLSLEGHGCSPNTSAVISHVCFSLSGLPNNSAASAPWEKVAAWLEWMQPEQETCVGRMPAINVGLILSRQVYVTR